MSDSPLLGPQFMRFLIAGFIGLGADIAVLYVLAPEFGWYAARVLSFLVAATTTWGINRQYAFRPVTPPSPGQQKWVHEYARYLLSMAVGGAANYATYALVLHTVAVPQAPWIGVASGSAMGLAFNFAAARIWVFRPRHL